MKCNMCRGIYLRADGRLPCYCGIGETKTLGRLPLDGSDFDFVQNYYKKGLFKEIREKMARGLLPFPGICDQCRYMNLDGEVDTELIDSEVEWFQWEPSFLCMLDCQWCSVYRREYNKGSNNKLLPFDVFEKLVKNLSEEGFKLKMGNVCGYGEPTMNKYVWDMIKLVKDELGGDILISTNGNGPYSEKIVPSGLTKLKIAVDGTTQKIYERYRKNGRLGRILKFTERVANDKKRLNAKEPKIIWQYILFNYNDSDKELIRFQKMAMDNDVNQLRMLYTFSNNYSKRTPKDFPKIFPDIIFSTEGQDPRISLSEMRRIWEDIQGICKSHNTEKAIIATIKLVKSLYHNLTMGIQFYGDFLAFAKHVKFYKNKGIPEMSKEDFLEHADYIRKSFLLLEKLYRDKGETEQALGYRDYLKSINVEY